MIAARSLTAMAALILVVSVPAAEAETAGFACFRCNEEFHEGYGRWEHYDAYFAVQGDRFQGNFHSQDWSTCIGAISSAGHELYGSEDQFGGETLDNAVADGADGKLLAVFASNPNVELNLHRSAIQIVNEITNEVVYHVRLPRLQLERLATALSDVNERR